MTGACDDMEGGGLQNYVEGRFSLIASSLRHLAIANIVDPIVHPPRCARDINTNVYAI